MSEQGSLRQTLGRFGLALVAVLLLGLGAGYLFGRSTPERAASTVISSIVVDEPPVPASATPAAPVGAAAPTSGHAAGPVRCGVTTDAPAAEVQVAALAAGIVVVQYRPDDVSDADVAALRAWADEDPDAVLLAPNPAVATPVMATAWGRRLPLDGPNIAFLRTFVTAHGGAGPSDAACGEHATVDGAGSRGTGSDPDGT